ncbi:HAD-superfamily hydrolase [Spiroplasma taiwanense CT-1]|uniref:HAD-superfamily hydrolase n=1 Tax=Spiroplasma taiwanense CT-1 TaxID=1276220 RepID=S5MAG0_9MOLU|nr:HAD-superfamily hydrolase [Spiroplasma taiwanense CT-1]
MQHNDYIDPRDLNFINEWIKEGNYFAIATGRMENEIAPVLERQNIKWNYMVCNNGAVVYEKGVGAILNASIPMNLRTEIIELFEAIRNKYILGYCIKDQRRDYSKVSTKEIDNNEFLSKYAPKENNFEIGKNEILNSPDLNLLYFYINEDQVEEVKELLKNKLIGCKAVRTHKNVIEIMKEEVSKAQAIREIQKLKNFSLNDLLTSGDGENDIEMLSMTKNSFAMNGHQPGVEKHATFLINNVFEIKNKIN